MVEMVNSRQCIYSIILGRLIYYGYCNAFLDANESVGLVLTCYMFALDDYWQTCCPVCILQPFYISFVLPAFDTTTC